MLYTDTVLIHQSSFSLLMFLQAQSACLPHLGGVDVYFRGITDCFIQVVRNKGVLSLWNGLTANTVKVQFHLYIICHQYKLFSVVAAEVKAHAWKHERRCDSIVRTVNSGPPQMGEQGGRRKGWGHGKQG